MGHIQGIGPEVDKGKVCGVIRKGKQMLSGVRGQVTGGTGRGGGCANAVEVGI